MPFTKKYFVIGKVILRSFNIFSNKTTRKCTLNFKVKKKKKLGLQIYVFFPHHCFKKILQLLGNFFDLNKHIPC